jgi:hypothetical protein
MNSSLDFLVPFLSRKKNRETTGKWPNGGYWVNKSTQIAYASERPTPDVNLSWLIKVIYSKVQCSWSHLQGNMLKMPTNKSFNLTCSWGVQSKNDDEHTLFRTRQLLRHGQVKLKPLDRARNLRWWYFCEKEGCVVKLFDRGNRDNFWLVPQCGSSLWIIPAVFLLFFSGVVERINILSPTGFEVSDSLVSGSPDKRVKTINCGTT